MARHLPSRALLACLALFLAAGPARAAEGSLEAGFAVVEATPQGPGPLGGYGARLGRAAEGVHDPIRARAAVFRDGARSLGLVVFDLVGVSASLREEVSREVADLRLDELVVAATHTHSGPGGLTDVPAWLPAMGPLDPARRETLVARAIQALRAAHADLRPARAVGGRRDGTALARLVRNRATPEGPTDPSIGVLRVDAPDGSPRAVFVQFAAHPTILGPSVGRLSADWPGAVSDAIEEEVPGATAFFLAGAMGDVAPVVPSEAGEDPFERVRAYGRLVAGAAMDLHEELGLLPAPLGRGLVVHGTSTAWAWTVAGSLLGRTEASDLAPGTPWALPVTRFELGGIQFVTVPGEPVAAVARQLGAGPGRWIVACAQDHLGYFADRDLFHRGGYEADLSFFGPDAADRLAVAAEGVTAQRPVAPPAAPAPPGPHVIRASPRTDEQPGRALGRAHGEALGHAVRDLATGAESLLIDEMRRRGAGILLAPWSIATGLPPARLAMPALVQAARRLQRHVPLEYLLEMEGLAEAAGLPYDTVLVENVFLTLAEQTDPAALLQLPARCTNLVATGEATAMGQLLHASTLDWGMGSLLRPRTVTLVLEPVEGHPFVSVTWPGMVGTLRAMGAQGLALTEESCAAPGDTTIDGLPVNLLMRQVVQHASGLPDAVSRLREAPGTCGYKITVSDGRALDARTVATTARMSHVRKPRGGLLYGCDPEAGEDCFDGECNPAIPRSDTSSERRYPVVRARLERRHGALDLDDVLSSLGTREGGVLDADTLFACAFEPQRGLFHVALREDVDAAGEALRFRPHDLLALLPPEVAHRYRPPWPVTETGEVVAKRRAVQPLQLGGVSVEDVWFPSPVRSGHPENDKVHAELYLPADPLGIAIQLPAWKEANLAGQRLAAFQLARAGIGVMLLPLPYQDERALPGERSGARSFSHDLARSREVLFQGAADVARASLWLERARGFPPERQAVIGVSLGGHAAALALGAYPDRFGAGVFLLAGGGLERLFLQENGVTDGVTRRLRERGVTAAAALAFVGHADPVHYGRPELRDRVLLIAGTADRVVPPESARALAEAWGGARILWLEGGHYGVIRHAGAVFEALSGHLQERFGAAR